MEHSFQHWLQFQRFLESLTEEQLIAYAQHGRLPEPLPEPLPLGKSRLDGLDRKSLIKLWEENERFLGGRSKQELIIYATHGHWPEQACDQGNCPKPEVDERVRRLEAKA
jgi:hypothetical protein